MALPEKMYKRWLLLLLCLLPIGLWAQDEESVIDLDEEEFFETQEELDQDEDNDDLPDFEELYEDESYYEEDETVDYIINRERRAIQEDHGDVQGYRSSEIGTTEQGADWTKITEGYDYEEASEKETEEVEEEERTESAYDWSDRESTSDGDPTWWKYLLIVLIAAVVVFVLVKLFQDQGTANVKVANLEVALAEAEENIQETELEALLRQALEEKDYRSALRIRYLMVLKELDGIGWIKHRIHKTNWTYFLEFGEREERPAFKQLTDVFDYTWYGNISLTEKDDRLFASAFGTFLNNLKDHRHE